jgi:hypothetical protein
MSRDPDQLPDLDHRKGRCPHCGRASNFERKEGPLSVQFDPMGQLGVTERVGVVRCPGCNKGTVVIEEAVVTERPRPPATGARPRPVPRAPERSATERVVTGWCGVHWWPVPGAADLDQDIPEGVASAFGEGMRALSANCPCAAAVMFRAMLAALVRDQGSRAAQQAGGLRKLSRPVRHLAVISSV